MATAEKSPCSQALTDEWYYHIRQEVDYDCSFCDAVHTDIQEMQDTVRRAYEITAESMRSVRDVAEIAKRWWGMSAFANEILSRATFLQQTHQICGVDLTPLQEYLNESLERFQLHCPEFAEGCGE
jgi:hypothetical protein